MASNQEERRLEVSRKEFFDEWVKHEKNIRNSKLYEYVTNKYNIDNISEESVKEFKHLISLFSSKLQDKWNACSRKLDTFLKKQESWLRGENLVFKFTTRVEDSQEESFVPQPSTSGAVGRPKLEFMDASTKTKKRRVEDLVQSRKQQELVFAAEVSLRTSGQRVAADLIKEITTSPRRASKMKRIQLQESRKRPLTCDEALAYYVDAKCTSHSYKTTRKWTMKAGHKVFPSYYALRKAKLMCIPNKELLMVTETRAEIDLQAILNITAERLVQAQRKFIDSVSSLPELTLISKWGCDGSSGHSKYKQKFADESANDEYLFLFSFVPIKLCESDCATQCIWQNPRPSSTMYCRPIKFLFAKEDDALTKLETGLVLDQIRALKPTKIHLGEKEIIIHHKLLFTMLDGKVCNSLTETQSTQTCYICKATPKLMNEQTPSFVDNEEHYGFGISPLHAWIRCLECFLHISYRLEIKQWRITRDKDKECVKNRKLEIQKRFQREMGLIIDRPKPSFGSTNDGNTARRFFKHAALSAEITGLDVDLLKRICILLQTLSFGYDINVEHFKKYAEETRKLYLRLYSWYYMPVTLHKILVHGANIIKSSLLPLGQLSEEAQEARNKDCRRFREHHTQKTSRTATNGDLLNMLLITSDPVINVLRDIPRKRASLLPPDLLSLVNLPSPASQSVETEQTDVTIHSDGEEYIVSDSTDTFDDDSSDSD